MEEAQSTTAEEWLRNTAILEYIEAFVLDKSLEELAMATNEQARAEGMELEDTLVYFEAQRRARRFELPPSTASIVFRVEVPHFFTRLRQHREVLLRYARTLGWCDEHVYHFEGTRTLDSQQLILPYVLFWAQADCPTSAQGSLWSTLADIDLRHSGHASMWEKIENALAAHPVRRRRTKGGQRSERALEVLSHLTRIVRAGYLDYAGHEERLRDKAHDQQRLALDQILHRADSKGLSAAIDALEKARAYSVEADHLWTDMRWENTLLSLERELERVYGEFADGI